jgi:hypothetical protein
LFTGVEERDGEEGGTENEEGEDAVDAVEGSEVVEKDFDNNDAEEHERLPAEERGSAEKAESDESGSVTGPEDGDGEVLSERVVEGNIAATKIVPEFEAESENGEEIGGDGKRSDFGVHGF